MRATPTPEPIGGTAVPGVGQQIGMTDWRLEPWFTPVAEEDRARSVALERFGQLDPLLHTELLVGGMELVLHGVHR